MLLAILQGRLLELQVEAAHEIADIGISALAGDCVDGQLTVQQKQARPLHPALGDILHGADPDGPPEMG